MMLYCEAYAGARVVMNYYTELNEIHEDRINLLTNDCLQVAQMMDFAASLALAWLFEPFGSFLLAFLSRF